MDAIGKLTALILDRLPKYCATKSAEVSHFRWVAPSARWESTPSLRESTAFLRGIEAGLVAVNDRGYVTYPAAAVRPSWPMPFFSRASAKNPGAPIDFWWELLTQTMAYTELILDYRWPR